MALLLLGIGAAAVPVVFDDDPTASRADGNRPVSARAFDRTDISANNSPTLVRSPVDERELAVSNRIDSPRFSCALQVSRDDGVRWSQIPIPAPKGEEPKCFAPDVAYGADGTLFLTFVTLKGRGNVPNAVWLTRRQADGSLSTPRKLAGKLSFQVRLVADPVKPGRLYLTWLKASDVALYQFPRPGNPVVFMRSEDGGRTWGRQVRVSPPALERVVAPSLAVGADGDLHMLYLDLAEDRLDYHGAHEGQGGQPYPGPWRLVAARSEDRGHSWENALVDARLKPIERFLVFLPAFPSLAADPERDRLYASFHDGRLGDPDVLLWTSGDGGRSWSEPRRINDTRERDGRTQYLPKVAVAPNGRVDVLYYDRRRDPRNRQNEVAIQSSFDRGASFASSLRLSEGAFDSRVGFGSDRDLPDIGSRLGLASADTDAVGVWTDTRAGTEISRKQDQVAARVLFSDGDALSQPLEAVLRYGGVALVILGLGLIAASVIRRPRGRPAS